jgi:4-hydroxybenzoate-CoA ligase
MLDEFLTRRPYNAAADFIDGNIARGLGGKTVFVDGERALTYAELQARTYQFAGALHALGLRPEERIALLSYDTVDYPVAFWGALRAGIVVIPLNTLLARTICLHPRRQPCR